jgi:predicted AAA+ superfamily ATPase
MFERNAFYVLEEWANREDRKPLILRGARQVGKTTLVNSFSKLFNTYLYLNLENEEAVKLFEMKGNLEALITSIFLHCNKARSKGKTLLFIDEIQYSPKAVAKLRYFYEEASYIHVIAAGSLFESLIDTHISFPVGRVEYMAIRPCTFNEFLGALGERELEKALCSVDIPEAIHSKTMDLFNTYTLVGGMPEAVSYYSKNRDLVSINKVYETLLSGYKNDVEKYSKNEIMTHIIRYILNEGWTFAAQRITLGGFAGSSYKSREMGEAFRTLEKTMLLELTYPTTHNNIPVYPDLKRSPKLLWLDTGLVNYSAGIQKEVFGAKDIIDVWRGAIAEQITAQELLASDCRVSHKRKFWVRDKQGSDAEVDFILQWDSKVIPIEVKSGHNSRLRSLHLFMENANHATAVRIWSQPFSVDKVKTLNGKEFNLINVPFYYSGFIKEILERFG